MKRLIPVLGVIAAGAACVTAACSSDATDTTDAGTNDDGGGGGGDRDATSGGDASSGDRDAGTGTGDGGGSAAAAICAMTRDYVVRCNGDLNCGDAGFDDWCEANDKATDSDAFRRAQTQCLPTAECDESALEDCDYQTYATATPTASQKALVAAYCQTCAPADANCATASVTYDKSKGPLGATDIFIAAWELADPLVEQITAQCTGSAFDAGLPDGGTDCVKAFSTCSGGLFIDNLPDCPN